MKHLPLIGVLGLSLKLHDELSPGLKESRAQFLNKVLSDLNDIADFDFPGACNTKEEVDAAVERFESGKKDGILIVFLTYAPSLIALAALKKTRLPFLIWNTQEAEGVPCHSTPRVLLENHGVHGVQDLCCILNRLNIKYNVLTGHPNDNRTKEDLLSAFTGFRTWSALQTKKIGQIGYSMQGMGDFNVDETILFGNAGTEIIHIPVDELSALLIDKDARPCESEINEVIANDRERFIISKDITYEEHAASARMEITLRKLIKKYGLNAWSQYFAVLNSNPFIPCQPYLAASKLMSEGIHYSAEGDVTAAVASVIAGEISGMASFTEMYTMDFNDNALLMRHIGEFNILMARKDRPVRIIKKIPNSAGKMQPLTPVFSPEPGESTILSVTTGRDGKLKFVTGEGEILDLPEAVNMDSPTFKWRPDAGLHNFLNAYARVGGSHHQAICFGRMTGKIEFLAKIMDINFYRI